MSHFSFKECCCAGLVTYNPRIELLKACLDSVFNQVCNVIIVDNGSHNADEIYHLCKQYPNVDLEKLGKNKGISAALNVIAQSSQKYHCSWFLTLDQDSVCPEFMIEEYALCKDKDDVGMICPTISLRIHGDEIKKSERVFEDVDVAITSGCLVRYKAWEKVGGFWEYLFIDKVDDDFCYALKQGNYRIVRSNNIILQHEIGSPKLHHLAGISYYTDSYPPFRYYYIARNSLIHYCITGQKLLLLKIIAIRIIKIICGENNKIPLLKQFFRGIKDGVVWNFKFGKRGEPSVLVD